MRLTISIAILLLLTPGARGSEPRYLYRATFVQAAPGKLLDLIDYYKASAPVLSAAGEEPPMWIRHSQGDKWDLMLLLPMESYSRYYQPGRVSKRDELNRKGQPRLRELVAWQEDLFVYGPPLSELRSGFANAGFFHLEIFQSLPGKHEELYKQRQMENAYLKALKRPENFIFVRDQGAGWDLFTLGLYRDIKHYAESADIPPKDQESAAKAAGFEAANRIGPYLRTLISAHHDTLAVAVK